MRETNTYCINDTVLCTNTLLELFGRYILRYISDYQKSDVECDVASDLSTL